MRSRGPSLLATVWLTISITNPKYAETRLREMITLSKIHCGRNSRSFAGSRIGYNQRTRIRTRVVRMKNPFLHSSHFLAGQRNENAGRNEETDSSI